MGDRLSLIKHIKGDCCRRLSLGFASSPQTDTFSCFNFVLKAELALFCHTEDRNYQRHFSQSSEAREHFSQERNQRSQRLSEGGISCFRKHLFHQEEILLAPNMWLLTQLHVDYLTLQQMSTCWEAFTFFRHSRIKSMMKRPLSTNVRTWEHESHLLIIRRPSTWTCLCLTQIETGTTDWTTVDRGEKSRETAWHTLPQTHSHIQTNTSGLILFSVISQENIHKSQSLNPNTDMLFVCVCTSMCACCFECACLCVCASNCISLPEIEALTKPFSCSLLLIPQKDRFCILAWVYNAIYSC